MRRHRFPAERGPGGGDRWNTTIRSCPPEIGLLTTPQFRSTRPPIEPVQLDKIENHNAEVGFRTCNRPSARKTEEPR